MKSMIPGPSMVIHSLGATSVTTQQSAAMLIVPVATGVILLGIGLYSGFHGATAIGLILTVLFGIRALRSRSTS